MDEEKNNNRTNWPSTIGMMGSDEALRTARLQIDQIRKMAPSHAMEDEKTQCGSDAGVTRALGLPESLINGLANA